MIDIFANDTERGPNARYQMFSREGNDACEAAVAQIVIEAEAGQVTRKTLRARVERAFTIIEAMGHGEVYDTEPQYQIADEITARVCRPQMWAEFSRWGDEA